MKKFLLSFFAICIVITGFACFVEPQTAIAASLAGIPVFANMSREDLEELAMESLSDNYEGEDDEIDLLGFSDYDGSDDDLISFMGSARSFLDEKRSGVYLQFKIANATDAEKTICLNPGYYNTIGLDVTTEEGKVTAASLHHHSISDISISNPEIEAVIDDGTILTSGGKNITVTGINGKLRDHIAFVKRNPVRIPAITISSVVTSTGAIDTTIYNKILTIRRVSPYHRIGQDVIVDLNEFFDTKQFQAGKITVDTARYGLQCDDQTLFFLAIPAGLTVTFRFDIGAISNQAKGLYKKAETASVNVASGTVSTAPVEIKKRRKQMAARQLNALRKLAFRRK